MTVLRADRSMKARHPGTCPACGKAVMVGQRIVRATETQTWLHLACLAFGPDPDDQLGNFHDEPHVSALLPGTAGIGLRCVPP